jgi:hypothetical protein
MLYLVVDVPQARPFLDHINIEGLTKEDAAQILDKTRYAAAALFPPNSGKRLQAAAWGNYPSFRAGMAFASARDWKKRRSPAGSFWYSAEQDISLAFDRTRAFAALGPADPGALAGTSAARVPGTGNGAAASAAVPVPAAGPYPQGPGVPAPETFAAFREGACLALWLENPTEPLDRFLEGLGLPIRIPAEEFLAALVSLPYPEDAPGTPPPAGLQGSAAFPGFGETGERNLYEIRFQIRAPSETNARTLMTLFSAARLFIPRTGEGASELFFLLFSRPPEQEGPYIRLRSAPMSEEGVALLFTLFSIYSGQN